MKRFREPVYEQVALLLEAYWRPGVDDATKGEVLRTVIDTVQVHVGQAILRDLHRTRAYHVAQGSLGELELLAAGTVQKLVRETTGMAHEPAQPIERPTRRGLAQRVRKR